MNQATQRAYIAVGVVAVPDEEDPVIPIRTQTNEESQDCDASTV
jgi:hypothetical protein